MYVRQNNDVKHLFELIKQVEKNKTKVFSSMETSGSASVLEFPAFGLKRLTKSMTGKIGISSHLVCP